MVVYTPKNVMGSLLGGDDGGAPNPTQPIYQVNEGVCGVAWVNIKPGTSRFARWLIKEGYGRSDSYRGGVNLRLWNVCGSRYSQSLTRWEAATRAVAEVPARRRHHCVRRVTHRLIGQHTTCATMKVRPLRPHLPDRGASMTWKKMRRPGGYLEGAWPPFRTPKHPDPTGMTEAPSRSALRGGRVTDG